MRRFFRHGLASEGTGWLLIAAAWLIFFARILSYKYVYFLDDLKILYYPLEISYAYFQHAGQLPQWSPLFGMGQPLLAWSQLGFFTPLHLLMRALYIDPLNLLQISVMAYFALGLFGTYRLLRWHALLPLAAALGAILYIFSGFNIGHLNHVNFYVGTMVVPWLLLSIGVFVRRPAWTRAATMALLAATVALSAQPQMTLYIFCLAAGYGVVMVVTHLRQMSRAELIMIACGTAAAAAVAACLAALALLPLVEFLPLTERAEDLPTAELLDFSYPPRHAITLLVPYFFGNHTSYWGAKGFQELAAFTGLLPLLLASAALLKWRENRALRITGSLFAIVGILMALGQYFPIYRYLVTHHLLTHLNIPGRFVFFFTTGIAMLAAVGLNDMASAPRLSPGHRWRELAFTLLLPTLIVTPFLLALLRDTRVLARAQELANLSDPSLLLAIATPAIYALAWYALPRVSKRVYPMLGLVLLAAGTLLGLAYNYTPVSTRSSVAASLPLLPVLRTYSETHQVPARLYSRETLLNDRPPRHVVATKPFNAEYRILQPVTITNQNNPCFIIPMQAATPEGTLTIRLQSSLAVPALARTTVDAKQMLIQPDQRVCFTTHLPTSPWNGFLSFTSDTETTVRLAIYPTQQESAYLVRVANPNPEIIAASRKKARVDLTEDYSTLADRESLILERHLQVAGNASGGRWIGALSLKHYREFIEEFLANDREPIDGDGNHVVTLNRSILNMLGITHLAQYIPPDSNDRMSEVGFATVAEQKIGANVFRFYENPAAFPKGWLVPEARFLPAADETRVAMHEPDFDPLNLVYISGPKPPTDPELAIDTTNFTKRGSIHIVQYDPTRIQLEVTAPGNRWLVLSDSTTPQWETSVDGEKKPYYIADSFMKAAFVPTGQHTVVFEYHSPAIVRALWFTALGAALLALMYLLPTYKTVFRRILHSR